MQVIFIVELFFAIKCWYFLHGLSLPFMLVKLLLILVQFRYINSHKLIDRVAVLMVDKLGLDIFECQFPDRLDKCMELIKVDLLHGFIDCYQLQVDWVAVDHTEMINNSQDLRGRGVLLLMVLLGLVAEVAQSACGNEGMIALPQEFSNYTSAKAITRSQQQQLITLYSSLPNIQKYTVSIQSNFSFYYFSRPICIRQFLPAQNFNALKDIWVCFDEFQVLQCNEEWNLVIQCGTYLEFHKPFNPEVLISINLGNVPWINDVRDQKITNIRVKGLCAGLYHVWFVYYTRAGKFIRTYPGCTC